MPVTGTPSNTAINNRVTKEKLEEAVAELNSNIQSKERQLQAKDQQLNERNEYILQLEEQLQRAEARNSGDNEQPPRIQTVNVEEEDGRHSPPPPPPPPPQPLPANPPHQEEAMIPRIPAPQLPKFDGKGSATEWWMSFMAFISFTNIPAVRAIQMLHFYFTGISLQWFTFLDPRKKTSLEIFKQAFFDRFKPSSPINKDLLRIQQQPGEGVEEYLYRVRKLATDSTMDESAVTELAKDGLHQRLRELVVPQRPTTLDQLREQAILAEDAVDLKRPTSNQIPCADSQAKAAVDASLVAAIQAAMMNIMPANGKQHRQDEEVNAVYSPRPHHQRSSNNQWPRRRGPCLRCGDTVRMAHPAARSVHLWFDLPKDAKCVCNEVCVSKSQKGTYFCVIGFTGGYSGIQELYDGKKMAIFSVWDSSSNTDPSEDKQVQVMYSGEGVEVSRFGNEGTGGKTMMPLEWRLNEPVQFKMEAQDVDGTWTAYSCYVKMNSTDWFHMATMKTIANRKLLNGVYSFVEDFRRDGASHCEIRSAKFGDCYSKADDCQSKCQKATFTADSSTPTMNIDAGLCGDKFYLTTGGDTKNTSTQLNCCIAKPPETK